MRTRHISITTSMLLLVIFVSTIIPASAQYFPPVPPEPIVVRETPILVSFTEPQKTITINVTQFDPEQVVKSITLTFKEPVRTASLTIYHLKEKPAGIPEPPDTSLFYFTIRAHEDLLENVERVVIMFSIDKGVVEEKKVDEKTIVLGRFFENRWEKLPTTKIAEDERFLYFKAEAPGLSHFAATGIARPSPFPWWIIALVVIVVAVGVISLYIMRRGKRV